MSVCSLSSIDKSHLRRLLLHAVCVDSKRGGAHCPEHNLFSFISFVEMYLHPYAFMCLLTLTQNFKLVSSLKVKLQVGL